MNALRTVDLLDSIIPISRFNKGEANKIFSEVKKNGIRIVVKNNIPECVLISPKDYQQMVEEYEDSVLLSEAEKRIAKKTKTISHQELMKRLGFTKEDLDDIDAELEQPVWKIKYTLQQERESSNPITKQLQKPPRLSSYRF